MGVGDPHLYSASLGLPSPEGQHRKICRHALAKRDESNLLSSYEGVMGLLFEQLKQEARREPTSAR